MVPVDRPRLDRRRRIQTLEMFVGAWCNLARISGSQGCQIQDPDMDSEENFFIKQV
jgi:hypothetical protein